MKNINRNAKQALFCNQQTYLTHQSIGQFHVSGEQEFTIEALLILRNMSDGLIYSQPDGFELGIEDSCFYFKRNGTGKVKQRADIQLNTNEIYFVTATQKEQKVSLYLNAMLVGAADVSGTSAPVSDKPYQIAYMLDCYIVDLRLLSVGMTHDEIQKDFTGGLTARDGIQFWGDFTTPQYKDKSSNVLGLSTNGGIAKCVNIAGCTFMNSNGGYFGNRIFDETDAFSIVCNCYPMIEASQKMYLYSAVDKVSGAILFSICIEQNDNGEKVVCVENGGSVHETDTCLLLGSWIDIVLQVNKTEAAVYVDGEKQSSFTFSGTIGDTVPVIGIKPSGKKMGSRGVSYFEGFRGYIGYIASFGRQLSENEIRDFAVEQPYMFEKGLKSNYLFCCGNPIDIMNGESLYSLGNGKFLYEKELNPLNAEIGIDMHIPTEISDEWNRLPKYDKWLMTTTMNCVREVYAETYGVKMGTGVMPVEQVATGVIRNRFGTAIDLMDTVVSEEMMGQTAVELVEIAAASTAGGGVAMSTGAGSGSSFLIGLGAIMAPLVAGTMGLLLGVLSKKIEEKIKDDEDDKPENDSAEITILSACCNHQGDPSLGSLHFHSDIDLKAPVSMKYEKLGGKIDLDMLLVPPKLTDSVLLFDLTVSNPSDKAFTGHIKTAGSYTFGSTSEAITLSPKEEKVVRFHLPVKNVELPDFIEYREETLQFSYEAEEICDYICCCNCRIYLDKAVPCLPWRLQKTDDKVPESYDPSFIEYPSLMFIKLFFIDLKSSEKFEDSGLKQDMKNVLNIINQKMEILFNQKILSYSGQSSYTYQNCIFDLKKYLSDYTQCNLNQLHIMVNCTDCANIVSGIASSAGVPFKMAIISSVGAFRCNQVVMISHLQDAWQVPFDNGSGVGGFSYHQVCCDSSANVTHTTPIYDLCLKLDVGPYPGKPNTSNMQKTHALSMGVAAAENSNAKVYVDTTKPYNKPVYRERLVETNQIADFLQGTLQSWYNSVVVQKNDVIEQYIDTLMESYHLNQTTDLHIQNDFDMEVFLSRIMDLEDMRFNRMIWKVRDSDDEKVLWYKNEDYVSLGRHIAETLMNYTCWYQEEKTSNTDERVFVGSNLMVFSFKGHVLAIHAKIERARQIASELIRMANNK